MMALTALEHQRVQRETRQRRNASARARRLSRKEAERWCAAMGAEVQRFDHHGEWRWTVRVPGFFPATADSLERAVWALDINVTNALNGPATHGPTGASLARYRALRSA